MIEIAFPEEWTERWAFITATVTMLIGLAAMIMPVRVGRLMGLFFHDDARQGLSEMRGPIGGMWVGLGLACLLLAQPFTYFALGLGYLFAVIGRLLSLIVDRTFMLYCLIAIGLELLAAYFPLRFALEAFGLL